MSSTKKQSLDSAFKSLLRYQLLAPITLAAFIIFTATSFFAGSVLEAQQERFNTSVSYATASFIEHASTELSSIVFIMTNAPVEEITLSMQAQYSSHDLFNTLYLINSDGMIEMLVPENQRYLGIDMSRQKYYHDVDCKIEANISDPFISHITGEPTVYISRCIDGGYLLTGELNLSSLQETTYIGQSGLSQASIFIVDQNGKILAHPDFEHVTMQDNISNMEIINASLRGENSTLYYWYDGTFWFGTAKRIETTGWVVVTEVPFLVVYGPYLGAVLIMMTVLGIIFAIALQRFSVEVQRQVVLPLTKLSKSTDALASGNYGSSERITEPAYSLTEVERLVLNFENMRKSIFSRETLLKDSEKQYRRLVKNSPDAILVHHDGVVVYANDAANQLYKANNERNLIGISVLELVHLDSKKPAMDRLEKIRDPNYKTVMPMTEQKHIKLDGSTFDAEVITSSIFFDGKYEAQSIVRDISRRKDEENRLQHQASHDYLTNLPNRFFFEEVLEHTLIKNRRTNTIGAILYLDIDGFKAINDTYGHATGDIVLKVTAQKLQSVLRQGDIVARLGGDEFVILIDAINDEENATVIAESILRAFYEPIVIDQHKIRLSCSIGISIFPKDGQRAQILLQTADTAMYEAKSEGKDRFKFYASEMGIQTEERVSISVDLQYALKRNEFTILYQPQINAQTGMLIGVEALLRWNHPKRGLTRPGVFIELAEETGQILPIGKWLLESVCQQIKKWEEIVPENFHIAVNLSNLQLKQPNLISTVKEILLKTGINPSLLEIELMENIVFQNPTEALSKLFELKSMGIKLAIDDFGTGYSMLGYLAHFPFDHLKIDQRLAPNLPIDPKEVAIVSGVIKIGQNLGLTIIAEAVETIEQIKFYQSLGCHDFQGWYYSREVHADEITKMLKIGSAS